MGNRHDVAFTEFTEHEITRGHTHSLEHDLIDKDFTDLLNEMQGNRRKNLPVSLGDNILGGRIAYADNI